MLVILFSCQRAYSSVEEHNGRAVRFRSKLLPVAIRLGVTPVPIPNTMVKTQAADDTMLATVWESRRLPDFFKN